jgi:hypothetical protein
MDFVQAAAALRQSGVTLKSFDVILMLKHGKVFEISASTDLAQAVPNCQAQASSMARRPDLSGTSVLRAPDVA